MRLPPTESRLSSAEDEGPFLTGEGILAASISRQNEFFMILLSALLEIFLELLEDEADDEVSEGDDSDDDDEEVEEGDDTWEHILHDHVDNAAAFRCTVIFLHMEHDLRGSSQIIQPKLFLN